MSLVPNQMKQQYVDNAQFQIIKTVDGHDVFVSAVDFELVARYDWYVTTGGYAKMTAGGKLLMHRLLLPETEITDRHVHHLNENTLDNRRENLQPLTYVEHSTTHKRSSRNTSGYKGVSFFRCRDKWKAALMYDGVTYWLGLHETAEQAARTYDAKVKEIGGNRSYLNFPDACRSK